MVLLRSVALIVCVDRLSKIVPRHDLNVDLLLQLSDVPSVITVEPQSFLFPLLPGRRCNPKVSRSHDVSLANEKAVAATCGCFKK